MTFLDVRLQSLFRGDDDTAKLTLEFGSMFTTDVFLK